MFSNCPVSLAWWSSTCHLYRNPTVWRPLVHSTPIAHNEWGARPRPRTHSASRTSPSSPSVSAAHQLVQLRCLHLRFFRRAICEASTLPGDRHPSRLHAKKKNIIEQCAAKNGKAVLYETKCYSQLVTVVSLGKGQAGTGGKPSTAMGHSVGFGCTEERLGGPGPDFDPKPKVF
jgi:hypothetical protein